MDFLIRIAHSAVILSLVHYLVSFLFFAAFLRLCWSVICVCLMMLNNSSAKKPTENWKRIIEKLVFPGIHKIALVTLGFALGMYYQKAKTIDNTNHMQNVDIVRRYDPHHFRVLSEDVGQTYDIQLCNETPPDWQEGMVLVDFVYEQETTCQRLDWYRQSRNIRTGKLITFKRSTNAEATDR